MTDDYTQLLRDAVQQAKAKAPGAVEDLIRCVSKASQAVQDVTNNIAVLELVPLNDYEENTVVTSPRSGREFQLVFRRNESEAPPTDLGVFVITPGGYPIVRWFSLYDWGERDSAIARKCETLPDVLHLEQHFKWLVSNPDSRLVVLVTFFQQ